MARLVSLLDDNVVLHGDGGGKALAMKKPVVGSLAVARFRHRGDPDAAGRCHRAK